MGAAGRFAVVLGGGVVGVLTIVLAIPLLFGVGSTGPQQADDACSLTAESDGSPSVLGPSTLAAGELVGWWESSGRGQPPGVGVPVSEVAALYVEEGAAENVRGDLAFAQAVHETGWFSSSDTALNNFAGIAHYDGTWAGRAFPDFRTGVRAHIQLLKKYAGGNDVALAHPNVAPRAGARATTWGHLAGTWASDPNYWSSIRRIYESMLSSANRDLAAVAPSSVCHAPVAAAPTGTLTTVRGITVDASIAAQLDAMLAAAESDGLVLTGTGYRSHQRQIELRRAHCGTSHYAIYEMPASQCSPPTARPGTSRHEEGLAIDFANCASRSTPCYQWLAANAATYGFYNLPSESWHWSRDGS